MKRIIPILAVLCLVVVMAVPAFAAEESYTISGHWLFNETLSLPGFYPAVVDVNFTSNGMQFVRFAFYKVDATAHQGKRLEYRTADSFNVAYYWESTGINQVDTLQWQDEMYRAIDFGINPQVVDEAFFNWLVANAVNQDCDGAICSSVDADGDGYCDNCGGFFTPPPPGPLVEVMTELKEQNQLNQVLMGVVTIIPIGLGFLVGYKGLRKALDLLRTILHQA